MESENRNTNSRRKLEKDVVTGVERPDVAARAASSLAAATPGSAGSALLSTAAMPGANPSAVPPIVDAARIDQPALAAASRDLTDADIDRRFDQRVAGADLPLGVGETSLEPGASMPHVDASTRHTAALEAIAAATLPPQRSPVFPAGADPAGAILEGQAGSMQSVPHHGDLVGRSLAGTTLGAALSAYATGLMHPPKDGGPVRISAKRAGFRRCGLSHPEKPVDHPAGFFSMDEIREMELEPMLVVQRLEWDRDTPTV